MLSFKMNVSDILWIVMIMWDSWMLILVLSTIDKWLTCILYRTTLNKPILICQIEMINSVISLFKRLYLCFIKHFGMIDLFNASQKFIFYLVELLKVFEYECTTDHELLLDVSIHIKLMSFSFQLAYLLIDL
jgi:hypothetical protein